MASESGSEQERLAALVGRWRTRGWTRETAEAPALEIDSIDEYEWLPGGFALLHRVDARVGEERVEGAEIIGWSPERGAYVTQYFGSDGPNAYEATLGEGDGALVWRMRSATDRFTGTFSADGDDRRPLGAARRRPRLAAVDGDHADQAAAMTRAGGRHGRLDNGHGVSRIDRAPLEVTALRRAEARAAADVLAASHHEYPSFRHLFPSPERRRRALRAFFAATARDAAAFGASHAARRVGGRLLAVALWLPPGRFPWTAARKLRATPAFARVALAAPRSSLAFMRTGANTERAHPPAPHWYLVVLGVRPEAQRQGLGTRLLAVALERADREGSPSYLETAREENVAYYERFGFELIADDLQLVPDGPTHWAMSRPAPGTR